MKIQSIFVASLLVLAPIFAATGSDKTLAQLESVEKDFVGSSATSVAQLASYRLINCLFMHIHSQSEDAELARRAQSAYAEESYRLAKLLIENSEKRVALEFLKLPDWYRKYDTALSQLLDKSFNDEAHKNRSLLEFFLARAESQRKSLSNADSRLAELRKTLEKAPR